MAYYLIDELDIVLKACKSKVEVLCSIFYMLDEYKKLALILYLSEYIMVKHKHVGAANGDKWYIDHTDVIADYEPEMRRYIGRLFSARDSSVHLPGTTDQKKMWHMMWEGGYVLHVLQYEGFM